MKCLKLPIPHYTKNSDQKQIRYSKKSEQKLLTLKITGLRRLRTVGLWLDLFPR